MNVLTRLVLTATTTISLAVWWLTGTAAADLSRDELDSVATATVLLAATVLLEADGQDPEARESCFLGSGIMIHREGWIVTNHHVVAGLAEVQSYADLESENLRDDDDTLTVAAEIDVFIVDSTEDVPYLRYAATVENEDASSDLALLRVTGYANGRERSFSDLPSVELGASRELGSQANVTILGYPIDEERPGDEPAETAACAPIPDRSIRAYSGRVSGFEGDELDPFEVDATASRGNSGGSVVDDEGNLVGISARVRTRFAGGVVDVIPVERVQAWLGDVAPELLEPSTDPDPDPPAPTPTSPPVPSTDGSGDSGDSPTQTGEGSGAPGKPTPDDDQPPPPTAPPVALTYSATFVDGQNPYQVTVWIDATPEQFATIQSVTYYLHPTFVPSVVTRTSPADAFRLDFSSWGEFEIRAEVLYTDSTVQELRLYLDY